MTVYTSLRVVSPITFGEKILFLYIQWIQIIYKTYIHDHGKDEKKKYY